MKALALVAHGADRAASAPARPRLHRGRAGLVRRAGRRAARAARGRRADRLGLPAPVAAGRRRSSPTCCSPWRSSLSGRLRDRRPAAPAWARRWRRGPATRAPSSPARSPPWPPRPARRRSWARRWAIALTQPPAAALLVFEALGLGLALPYLAADAGPAWRRLLPRPGAWMERLEQLLAFPLYASVAWLVWVLSQQAGPTGVAARAGGPAADRASRAWLYRAAARRRARAGAARRPGSRWPRRWWRVALGPLAAASPAGDRRGRRAGGRGMGAVQPRRGWPSCARRAGRCSSTSPRPGASRAS